LLAPSPHLCGESFERGGGNGTLSRYFRPLLEEIADLYGWHSPHHILALYPLRVSGAGLALRFEPGGPGMKLCGALFACHNVLGLIGEPYAKIWEAGGHWETP
jgi:hypothetical protein